VRTALLTWHVTAGAAGLLLGPAAMRAALTGRRRTAAGRAYLMAVTVLTVTAAALVALEPGALWPFFLLALATEAAVIAARRAPRPDGHVRLVCGSYVSLVTALLVVIWGSIFAWVLPGVIGSVLVERAADARRPPPARTPSRSPTPSSRQ
jgi:hypothetical protein